MNLNLLTIRCNQEDCMYNQEKKCNSTGIQIENMICETYEKEEMPDIDRSDSERDIKE